MFDNAYAHLHFTPSQIFTSQSGSVNALANNHLENFTRQRKFHFAKSTLGLFKMQLHKICR